MSAKSLEFAKYIRQKSLEMCHKGKSSHIGSVLSCADIIAVLYSDILNVDPADAKSPSRDRFILSKGHAGAGLYAALVCAGFEAPEILTSHYQNGSHLSGHVNHQLFSGIEISTGSLGHGLPISTGIALALKLRRSKSNVYTVMSDGELDEGSNWEAFLFASHHKLSNLKILVDRNMLQSITTTEETLAIEPLTDKLISFGFECSSIDGHDHDSIFMACTKDTGTKPHAIVCNTVKGKGVTFMENSVLWHYRSPDANELKLAMDEIL